ncbi:MAG: outer membrane protein [Hyphomicrobiaceae bacterium]
MKTTIRNLTLGVTAAAIALPTLFGMSALAGGGYGGGLKGMRGSYVPVPAPVPIPDYRPKWYLRADVGLGLNLGTQMNESGMTYGFNDTANDFDAASVFGFGGLTNFDNDSGHDYGHTIGFGAGYYYTKNFRVDITGEFRMEKETNITGNFNYADTNSPPLQVNGAVREKVTLQSAIFMANGYIDMNRWGRWKPYIGGGIGFAVNDVRRTHNTDFSTCDPTVLDDCLAPAGAGTYGAQTDRQYVYTLAANVTAGVSYKISNVTSLDFNYRYLYVGGTDISAQINNYDSKINIEDQHEHYLRAGLRWDIN